MRVGINILKIMDAYLLANEITYLGGSVVVRDTRFTGLDPDHHVHTIQESKKNREIHHKKMD